MYKFETMLFGDATVEVLDSADSPFGACVERVGKLSGWVRLAVKSLCRSRGGYTYRIAGTMAEGWSPECNVRNFVRIA